ncbi:hypothetical protein GCM10023198_42700 [Promicromonospora umidemergens]|uniref:Uncharacterized protein n=1 Tax=Promicromonospora umidemergens TaxID=629679 RepID=A0ABP8XWB6_9MICO
MLVRSYHRAGSEPSSPWAWVQKSPVAMWAGEREGTRKAVPGARRDLEEPARTVAPYTVSDLHPARVVVTPLSVESVFVQPLPDGGYLIALSRCAWTPRGPEKNAVRRPDRSCRQARHA